MASIPSGNGTFTGCVASTGALKLIDTDAGQICPSGQTQVTWNQTGPAGPPGPQGPGAVALFADKTRPPLRSTPPAATTIATIGPLTFGSKCWRNSADNTVVNTLTVSSSVLFDLDEVIGSRANDTGAYTSGPADGNARGSAVVNTTVAASGAFFRTFVSPSILTVPSGTAHPQTYLISTYQFTDARATSRRCTIKGTVVPSG
jgi:hypothetical protein